MPNLQAKDQLIEHLRSEIALLRKLQDDNDKTYRERDTQNKDSDRFRWVSENIDTVAHKWGSFESWEEYCAAVDQAVEWMKNVKTN